VSFWIKLPATSANLGAAFDTAAIALDFYLELEAEAAEEFRIEATGRNQEQCGRWKTT
jgi:homoserine kinase